jgi:hypothetical protein
VAHRRPDIATVIAWLIGSGAMVEAGVGVSER